MAADFASANAAHAAGYNLGGEAHVNGKLVPVARFMEGAGLIEERNSHSAELSFGDHAYFYPLPQQLQLSPAHRRLTATPFSG